MEKLLSIPELCKKSWALYGPRAWTMILLGLVCWASTVIIMAVFGVTGFTTFTLGGNMPTFNLLSILLLLIGVLLLIIVNLWVQVALVYVVKEENTKASIKDLLMMVRGKIGPYFWVMLLKGLACLAGFVLFIIPGIILSVWFNFAQYAFVMEDKRGVQALVRSRELVKGYWWSMLGRLLLLVAAAALVSSMSKVGFFLNSLFVVPFGVIYLYVIYEDLKRVKATV